jgi:hypothetical protein
MIAGLMPNRGDVWSLDKPSVSNFLRVSRRATFIQTQKEFGGSHALGGGFQPSLRSNFNDSKNRA